jgi:glutaredoxin 1
MQRFTIFGHDACGFCRRAKAVMEAKGLPFRYVNIHDEGISPADLAETIGKPVNTVPQIFHGEQYIGGYQELTEYLETLDEASDD